MSGSLTTPQATSGLPRSRLARWLQGDPLALTNSTLLWRIFFAALLVRLALISISHTYRIDLTDDHFNFGWEMGRVGRALATGQGFADPFMGHTGPTAWLPPLYPLLVAAAFKLFGVYTNSSAWAIFAVNSLFSAATAPAVYEIGRRCFNRTVAVWSAWLWALTPAAALYAVHWIWDMAITACLFTWILVLALRARNIGEALPSQLPGAPPLHGAVGLRRGSPGLPLIPPSSPATTRSSPLWAAFGLLWGLIALLNSALLAFLPFCGLWMAWPSIRALLPSRSPSAAPSPSLTPTLARAALAAALCAACIAPWIARNYAVFHAFIPVRDNLGAEIYMSSLASYEGFPWGGAVSPYAASDDMQRYRALGELRFCQERGALGKAILRAHPGRLQNYTLKRIWFFWAGVPQPFENATTHSILTEVRREMTYCFLSLGGLLGLALALLRRRPGALLFAGAFLLLPITYYLVTVQARFRAPLEPLLFVLTVYLFHSAERTRLFSFPRTHADSSVRTPS